jgi:hypothetical protein
MQNMTLEKESKEKLDSLLGMAAEHLDGLKSRWSDLQLSIPKDQDSDKFVSGYVFGKIEHKFEEWFYSLYARSMTDEEYLEFWNRVTDYIKSFIRMNQKI